MHSVTRGHAHISLFTVA